MPLVLLIAVILQAGQVPLRVERLDNGLNLTIYTDDALPLVSVQAWLDQGWLADAPPPASDLPDAIRAYARHERRIYAEQTALTWTAPRELLPDLLRHAAAIVTDPQPADAPAETIGFDKALRTRLFQSDPPRPPVANAWAGRLVVIGNVVPAEVLPIVQEATRAIEWRDQPPLPPLLTPKTPAKAPTGRQVAFAVPGLGAFEHAAHEVLLQHLINPHDGPFFDAKRARWISGYQPLTWKRDLWSSGGVLLVDCPDDDGAARLLTALRQLRDSPLSPVALRRAIALARVTNRDSLGSFHRRARTLGEHEAIAGDLLLAPLAAERIALVRAEDVQNAADRLLAHAFAADDVAQPDADRGGLLFARLDVLPELRKFANPRPLETELVPQPNAPLVLCRLPGAAHAVVAVSSNSELTVDWPPARRDLFSYRGIEFTSNPKGFALRGFTGDGAALLEIAHRLISEATQGAGGVRRIALVSDAPPDELAQRIRLLDLTWPQDDSVVSKGGLREEAGLRVEAWQMNDANWTVLPGLLEFYPGTSLVDQRVAVDATGAADLDRAEALLRMQVPEPEIAVRTALAEARRRIWLDGPEMLAWRLAQSGAAKPTVWTGPLTFAEALVECRRQNQSLPVLLPIHRAPASADD